MINLIDIIIRTNSQWQVWKYYIYQSIRATFPNELKQIYKNKQSPQRPVLDQIEISTPFHQPLVPSTIDERTNANNLQIIEKNFIQQMGMSQDDPRFNDQLFIMVGDQKTVAQWRSVQAVWAGATRRYDRLQWLLSVFGLWHFKFNFLQLIHSIHWLGPSEDESSLWQAASHWGQKDVSTAKDSSS